MRGSQTSPFGFLHFTRIQPFLTEKKKKKKIKLLIQALAICWPLYMTLSSRLRHPFYIQSAAARLLHNLHKLSCDSPTRLSKHMPSHSRSQWDLHHFIRFTIVRPHTNLSTPGEYFFWDLSILVRRDLFWCPGSLAVKWVSAYRQKSPVSPFLFQKV